MVDKNNNLLVLVDRMKVQAMLDNFMPFIAHPEVYVSNIPFFGVDNNDRRIYFTPCACAHDKNKHSEQKAQVEHRPHKAYHYTHRYTARTHRTHKAQ